MIFTLGQENCPSKCIYFSTHHILYIYLLTPTILCATIGHNNTKPTPFDAILSGAIEK